MFLQNLFLLSSVALPCYSQLAAEPSSGVTVGGGPGLTTLSDTSSTVSENVASYEGNVSNYHLGYSDSDFERPFAKYWNPEVQGMSDATQKGLSASPHASELAFSPYEAKDYLTRPGYLQLENGWSVAEDGTLMIAILTDIGNVTGEMYDWWFGWHLVESARYKLWHPQAHRYAWRTPNTLAWTATNASTLPSRYISSHSFIDEYIGNSASKLTVNFVAPSDASALAFDESTFADRGIETIVVGRLHSGAHTTNVTGHSYLAHQVRRTADGRRELRSRFWLEQYTEQAAHDMMAHCNIEMQHLASFLPALFEEFKDTA